MFLYQPLNGYCYNSDSIFLYHFITSFLPKGDLLDIGCGVGIIGLLLTRDFGTKTTIIDKQAQMISYALHNFYINQLQTNAYIGDFASITIKERFDYIVSNPPFYDSNVTQSEDMRLNIARYAHHLPLDKLIAQAKALLKPKGWFIFCYDAKQIDKILYCLQIYGIKAVSIRFIHSKIDRDAKLVMIAARNNAKSMVQILPPFVIFDNQSNYLPEAQKAFERAKTHSIKGER